jgi:CRISPR-associated protein Cmr4
MNSPQTQTTTKTVKAGNNMQTQLAFVHALSSLHAGVGQGSGVIDLPIAREKATGIPFLPGSSLKGALRTRCFTELSENKNDEEKKQATLIFGPENLGAEDTRASLAQFSDQRLLLLPVRSLSGIFAWVTSPYMLHRLNDALRHTGQEIIEISDVPKTETCLIGTESRIKFDDKDKDETKVYLEDLDLNAEPKESVSTLASRLAELIFPEGSHWQNMLPEHLCIVHDNLFSFLLETATEITARIRLDADTKAVVQGALWYEELLPAESILYGVVMTTLPKNSDLKSQQVFDHLEHLMEKPIQLGGKATVGHGLCRVKMTGNSVKMTGNGGQS